MTSKQCPLVTKPSSSFLEVVEDREVSNVKEEVAQAPTQFKNLSFKLRTHSGSQLLYRNTTPAWMLLGVFVANLLLKTR